jgi:hypothetical protein
MSRHRLKCASRECNGFVLVQRHLSAVVSCRDGMRKRAFAKIAGVTASAGPIAEAATESIRCSNASGHVAFRFDAAQEGPAPVVVRRAGGQRLARIARASRVKCSTGRQACPGTTTCGHHGKRQKSAALILRCRKNSLNLACLCLWPAARRRCSRMLTTSGLVSNVSLEARRMKKEKHNEVRGGGRL